MQRDAASEPLTINHSSSSSSSVWIIQGKVFDLLFSARWNQSNRQRRRVKDETSAPSAHDFRSPPLVARSLAPRSPSHAWKRGEGGIIQQVNAHKSTPPLTFYNTRETCALFISNAPECRLRARDTRPQSGGRSSFVLRPVLFIYNIMRFRRHCYYLPVATDRGNDDDDDDDAARPVRSRQPLCRRRRRRVSRGDANTRIIFTRPKWKCVYVYMWLHSTATLL